MAYRDRSAVVAPAHAGSVNRGGGMLDPCVVVNGRVVGVWRRDLGSKTIRVAIRPLERLFKADWQLVADAAARYGAFMCRAIEISEE